MFPLVEPDDSHDQLFDLSPFPSILLDLDDIQIPEQLIADYPSSTPTSDPMMITHQPKKLDSWKRGRKAKAQIPSDHNTPATMFPLVELDDIHDHLFVISPIPSVQLDPDNIQIPEQLITNRPSSTPTGDLMMISHQPKKLNSCKRGRKSEAQIPSDHHERNNGEETNPNDQGTKKKKIMHRDVERQRRQEMAALYASLRSLLPPRCVKGKQAVSDHLNEAVNYINRLGKKIQELSEKREKMKRFLRMSESDNITTLDCNNHYNNNSLHSNCKKESVVVRPSLVGVEVILVTAIKDGPPLSTVLQVLHEEGLETIVRCNSTKMNDNSFLLTIDSEVHGEASTELLERVQLKLSDFTE